MRHSLALGVKVLLAAALIYWLVAVNVTRIEVELDDLSRGIESARVARVLVAADETLVEGQAIAVLETPGGEVVLRADRAGRVDEVAIAPGEEVTASTTVLALKSGIPFADLGKLATTWPWLIAAQVPFGIVLLLASWRWRILLSIQGIHYRLGEVHSLVLIGMFFNQVMLGATGGDVVKAYYVAVDAPGRRAAGVLTVFLDRALGLLVLVVVAAIAVLANLDLVLEKESAGLLGLSIALWVVLAASLAGGYVFYSERVRSSRLVQALLSRLPLQRIVQRTVEVFAIYRSHPRAVLAAVAISVAIHVLVVATNLLLLRCLETSWPAILPFFLLVPLAQIIMAVPLTPASLGTAEAAYDKLFALVGVPTGALVSLLQRLTYYFWATFGCIAYLRRKRRPAAAHGPGPAGREAVRSVAGESASAPSEIELRR